MKTGRRVTNTERAFHDLIDRSAGPSACWPWKGRPDRGGYGRWFFAGRTWWVHRLALKFAGQQVAPDMDVLHSCDNPPCCNPAHLRQGTARDNAREMVAKGRWNGPRGAEHHRAKLSQDDVDWIRTLRGLTSTAAIVEAFGISRTQVKSIVSGRSWRIC